MNIDLQHYKIFLKSLEVLNEKYNNRDDCSFNVFSTLRSASDEVNLHSRFLVALLNHCKQGDEILKNLKDFLENVSSAKMEIFSDYIRSSVNVEREKHNIDILILHPENKEAVIIENKIYAGDQDKQLLRYEKALNERGFRNSHLIYLTLDGHDPSENSRGHLAVDPVSYKDLLPWLQRCQQRAYDEPELRETISQYITLVRKLTGTDMKDDHISELKSLILKGENIGLAFDLDAALLEAKIYLLKELWLEIESALEKKCEETDFPIANRGAPDEGYVVDESVIRKFFTSRKIIWHGLWYKLDKLGPQFEGARLGIEIGNILQYGVRCDTGQNSTHYEDIQRSLNEKFDQSENEKNWWWPWAQRAGRELGEEFNFRNPNKRGLLFLIDRDKRKGLAVDVSKKTIDVWLTLQNIAK